MNTFGKYSRMAMAVAGVAAMALIPGTAFAEKGGRNSVQATTLALVVLDSTDGLAHQGQNVTFDVAQTATDQPWVSLKCYQGGALVASGTAGFFPSYPNQTFNLASPSWTSGAADCSARLYYLAGAKTVTVTTLDFHVYA